LRQIVVDHLSSQTGRRGILFPSIRSRAGVFQCHTATGTIAAYGQNEASRAGVTLSDDIPSGNNTV
jgi:hypothetical protein